MNKQKLLVPILCTLIVFGLFTLLHDAPADHDVDQNAFIKEVADAIPSNPETFPSVLIAQAILESQWGQSSLSVQHHNYFGIKAVDPNRDEVLVETQEFINGSFVTLSDTFQVYVSLKDSVSGYLDVLALPRYEGVRNARSFQEAAQALYDGGYATDPHYADKLIDIIETYRLFTYDTL